MLSMIAALLVQAAEPALDFSGVQEPLGGEPTRVLVLGGTHLSSLPEDEFDRSHVSLVLARLEAFNPDIIAIEAMPGQACFQMRAYEHLYARAYEQYCREPDLALAELGMTQPEAAAAVFERLVDWPAAPTHADRRRMAALLFGAGEPWSAALQWAQLPDSEQVAGDGVSEDLAVMLGRYRNSRNENNLLGVALGARLGLETLATVDDHTADAIYASAPDTLWPTVGVAWNSRPEDARSVLEMTEELLGSPEAILERYRYMNSPTYQSAIVAADFGNAAATPDDGAVARQYVAWWQTRGLRMAANVVEAAGNQPGARVLVITGASHKPYFDAYLDQMHDVELVSVDAVLHD